MNAVDFGIIFGSLSKRERHTVGAVVCTDPSHARRAAKKVIGKLLPILLRLGMVPPGTRAWVGEPEIGISIVPQRRPAPGEMNLFVHPRDYSILMQHEPELLTEFGAPVIGAFYPEGEGRL